VLSKGQQSPIALPSVASVTPPTVLRASSPRANLVSARSSRQQELPSSSDDVRPPLGQHSRRYLRRHTLASAKPHPSSPQPEEQWFNQDLDHFHPTDHRTWRQRYFVNASAHRANGPVFLMIGGEGEANSIWMQQGAWIDYANQFGAICFQLEHRYGEN